MKAIGNIHLIWRPGKGSRRISVGTIKHSVSEGTRFQYNQDGIIQAKKIGFVNYEGFPDTNKIYTGAHPASKRKQQGEGAHARTHRRSSRK